MPDETRAHDDQRGEVERVYRAWDAALGARDVDAAIALYAPDVELESPLVRHLLKSARGVVEGARRCAISSAPCSRARRPRASAIAPVSSPTAPR